MQSRRSWTDEKPKSLVDCIYFAIVTQSTTGYGDISPSDTVMRLLVIFQIMAAYSLPLFAVMSEQQ